MEKVDLSFVIGVVKGASFKYSVKGTTSSIGEIDSKIKLVTK